MTPAPAEPVRDLGVYVHWPYCARICPYCDFAVKRDRGRAEEADRLLEALIGDFERQSEGLADRRLVSVFFGGGTPSRLDPGGARRLLEAVAARFGGLEDVEVSLEANPSDCAPDRLRAFRQAGVTRLSVGAQSFSDARLSALGRDHDARAARNALAAAAEVFGAVSADVIYGLPGQTAAELERDLAEAVRLGATHVSAYELTIEAGTPFERRVRRGDLARLEADAAAELYLAKETILETLGLTAYEVSNHAASPSARCRHNLLYWTEGDYLGIGPSAHGRITTAAGRLALEAERDVGAWLARAGREGAGLVRRERLSPEAARVERVAMGLRCEAGAPLDALTPAGRARAEAFAGDGLLALDPASERVKATLSGRLLLDSLTLALLEA